MAGERAELEELRRLDALEAKAGGASRAPTKPDATEREAREIQSTTPAELIAANPIVRVLTGAAEPVLGAAGLMEKAVTGRNTNAERVAQLHEMQRRGSKALGFGSIDQGAADIAGAVMSPMFLGSAKFVPAAKTALQRIAQGGETGAISDITTPDEDARSGAKGGALGAGVAGAIEGVTKARGLPRFIASIAERVRGKVPEPSKPADTGAEKVLTELQRQRGAISGAKGVPAGASELERATKDFDERMKPLRDAAFNEGARVDVGDTLSFIQKLKEKNPDAQVQAALREAEGTIRRAAKGAQTANLPSAGARLTPAQLKALQGQGESLDVAMADEVRQSINRQIDQRGDKALSGHTQDLLGQIRDHIVGRAPQSYRSYLEQYAKGATDLDKVRGTAIFDKLTKGEMPVEQLRGRDAQNVLDKVFGGDAPGRDMTALVRLTAHDPAVAAGLRRSFGEWLTQTDAATRTLDPKALLKRWEQSRDAVEQSGLFTKGHAENVTKVMDELRASSASRATQRAVNSVAGFLIGGRFGHPFLGMHTARDLAAKSEVGPAQEAVDAAITQAAANPRIAAALAASPTAENLRRFEQLMAVELGKGREEPKSTRRVRQLLGTELR